MRYTSEFAILCRELFFQTGNIGYYILAENVEKANLDEEVFVK